MKKEKREELFARIKQFQIISFDMFDTLVMRKTNSPETVFDLVGEHFGIPSFRQIRMQEQNRAGMELNRQYGYPHANMDEIYEAIKEKYSGMNVDWDQVKAFETELEADAITANPEMLEVYQYAKEQQKRVIIVSDMYLSAETLEGILIRCGYEKPDRFYCSADERKAKFNHELFDWMIEQEGKSADTILHIGDNPSADQEIPGSSGIHTWLYRKETNEEAIRNADSTCADKGIYHLLQNDEEDFWYNKAIEAGGPLYTGLIRWLEGKVQSSRQKLYLLARDGYNLYHIFREMGYENVEYLQVSRRSLLLAGIMEIGEKERKLLPPFTFGQTVRDILDYLRIPAERIRHLKEAGFETYDDEIRNMEDMEKFRQLYSLDTDVFLEQCEKERKYAIQYFQETGFLKEDSLVFDCGWSGSSQVLIERFKEAIGCKVHNQFLYFGIINSGKSRSQLHGKDYEAFAFDFFNNYELQSIARETPVLFELFFSAPHESVYYYNEKGPVFESGEGDPTKHSILRGLKDYVSAALPFVKKYGIEYSPFQATGHLNRLILNPTAEEAKTIGDISNVDGFARKKGVTKKIAWIDEEQYRLNPKHEIYWMQGLLRRDDIPEGLKKQIAGTRGIPYPQGQDTGYHLEDDVSLNNYQLWLRSHEQGTDGKPDALGYTPKISVIMPVYNTKTEQLKAAIDSVLGQTYENYELVLIDDCSTWENVRNDLKGYEKERKVKIIYRKENGHISAATNDGIAAAGGEFFAFMDCDDLLAEDALHEVVKLLNKRPDLDYIYSDEDKVTEDGKVFHMPFFKPDWSPDLFLSMMYTNHLSVYRASLVRETGGLRSEYNGSQDYDFTFRFLEKTTDDKVGHISKILYHWRERAESVAFAMNSKNYAVEASRRAKEAALKRRGIRGKTEYVSGMNQYRVIYEVTGEPLISIIIPSRDHPDTLFRCIDSIREKTGYQQCEIIVVDNGSTESNRRVIQEYLEKHNARYIYDPAEFNFSKMCNEGAAEARGEYLLFLNDDIEILQRDWLERMTGQAQREKIGAVGAKLYYPESTVIQHAGISNIYEGPSHNFLRLDDSGIYYFGFNRLDYDCLAVTGACLLTPKELFEAAGGFDETFPIAYNDIDYCMTLNEKGYYCVQRNDVIAYHHESLSRGDDLQSEEKGLRLRGERIRLFEKHPQYKHRDPFLNEHVHTMSSVLDLKQTGASLIRMERVPWCGKVAKGSLDSVRIEENRLTISGWVYVPRWGDNRNTTMKLVLENPYGEQYQLQVQRKLRSDVAEILGREDTAFSGFECTTDAGIFRFDVMPYQIGVILTNAEGDRAIFWAKEKTKVGSSFAGGIDRGCEDYTETIITESTPKKTKRIHYSIDTVEEKEENVTISGWAFFGSKQQHKYRTEIILLNENGEATAFPTIRTRRLDVAESFINHRFIENCGFRCMIHKSVVPEGRNEIFLRMVNVFDDQERTDIRTGKETIGQKA